MNDFIEIRKVISTVLRWWWFLVFAMVAGAMIGYGVGQWQDPVYRATTTLIVGRPINSAELSSEDIKTGELLAVTYANMARLQSTLQTVIDNLGLDVTWKELKDDTRAAPVDGTQLLKVTVEAGSPQEATEIATELGVVLIQLSPAATQNGGVDTDQEFIRSRLDYLRTRIVEGQARIDALDAQLLNAGSPEKAEEIQSEIDDTEVLMAGWEATYTQMLTLVKNEAKLNFLAVAEPAHADTNPIWPRDKLNMIVAGILGLFLAVVLIVILEYLGSTLKSRDDVNRSAGLTALSGLKKKKS